MLVLSRKVGEEIVIAGEITVRVLGVQGQRIRIGIEAPPAVSIRRQELPVRSEMELEVELEKLAVADETPYRLAGTTGHELLAAT